MIKKKYLIVILFMILFITLFTRFSFASDPTLAANAAATDNTIYDANPGQADAAEPAEPPLFWRRLDSLRLRLPYR